MFRINAIRGLIVAAACLAAITYSARAAEVGKSQDALLAVLQSQAPLQEKWLACHELALVARADAVPALAAMLADEKSSDLARFVLEAMPDPAADGALRDTLGKLKGRLLVGVINSVGARRDAKAIEPLNKLLRDSDVEVASAAAAALARTGTPAAAKILQAALSGASTIPSLQRSLIDCADAMAQRGHATEAIAIFDRVLASQAAPALRAAAVRGAVLSRGDTGLSMLLKYLHNDDDVIFNASLYLVQHEMPGARVTQAIAAELPKLPAARWQYLVRALGHRGDAAALPAVLKVAESGEKPARLAAIRALAQLRKSSAVTILLPISTSGDAELADAAQEALASLPGVEADSAIRAMLESFDAGGQIAAIKMASRRRLTSATPAVVKLASSDTPPVRAAALAALGELAGEVEFPALLDLLADAASEQESDAVIQTIVAIARYSDHPQTCVDKIAARLAAAQPAVKPSLLRAMSSLGGATAFRAVRSAVDDTDEQVSKAAIRILAEWKDSAAASELLQLAKNLPDEKDRLLCLRSCLRLAASPDLPADQKLAICRKAARLTKRAQEGKLLIAAWGTTASTDALIELMHYVDNDAVRSEACVAILTISESILQNPKASASLPKLVVPLQQVVEWSGNPELGSRAKSLLKRVQAAINGEP
jgi:HEAT repeat protein